jgi:hypothetical protein
VGSASFPADLNWSSFRWIIFSAGYFGKPYSFQAKQVFDKPWGEARKNSVVSSFSNWKSMMLSKCLSALLLSK